MKYQEYIRFMYTKQIKANYNMEAATRYFSAGVGSHIYIIREEKL